MKIRFYSIYKQKHNYTHTGELPFACSYCPKRYVTKHKLKEHTMRHEGIKNHICSICGIGKTTPHELKVHLNCHTREKLFHCDQCELVFTSVGKSSLYLKKTFYPKPIHHQHLVPHQATFRGTSKSFTARSKTTSAISVIDLSERPKR